MIGQNLHLLRQFDYVAGATQRLDLGSIKVRAPDNRLNYVKGLLLEAFVSCTAASTSDAVTARQLYDLVRNISLVDNAGRKIIFDTPMNLAQLRVIETYLRGKAIESVTAVSADSNAVFTRTFRVYVPLEQLLLVDRQACIQPAAMLVNGNMSIQWSGSGLGTGQTIGATTRLRVYADMVARDAMEHRPELFIGAKLPATFSGDRIPLRGQVLFLGMQIEGASATIAANDFSDYGLEGRNTSVPRGTDVDIPTDIWNRHVFDLAAEKVNPTTGTIVDFPFLAPVLGDKLSDLPYEDDLLAYLTTGAGAPAVSDQSWIYAVVRPKDVAGAAAALGATSAVKGNAQDWSAALTKANAEGSRGLQGGIPATHPVAPFTASKVDTGMKCC